MLKAENIASQRQYYFTISLLWFLIFILVFRYFQLQILNFDKYSKKANTNRIRKVTLSAPRGLILDRNGNILVDNIPTYILNAIPGELLLSNRSIVKSVRDAGAEFINHGYKIHTQFDKKNSFYIPNFFYDKLDKKVIENDIKEGDKAIRKVLKLQPIGFRTPHFGTFQSKSHLSYLYKLLKQLDYKFSSSTSPDKSFFKGPIFKSSGIFEIPVSGCGSKPFDILDSWSFACPYPKKTSEDYLNEALKVKNLITKRGVGILNFYSDPSHVINDLNFWKAVNIWKEIATSINYSDLLKKIK